MKIFTIVTTLMLLSGCGLLQPLAGKIASGVEHYCVEPLTARQVIRDSINVELAGTGHTVHVHCAGDPPSTP